MGRGVGEASRTALPWFGSRLSEELVSARGRRLAGVWEYVAGACLCRWPWEASAHGHELGLSWRAQTGPREDSRPTGGGGRDAGGCERPHPPPWSPHRPSRDGLVNPLRLPLHVISECLI